MESMKMSQAYFIETRVDYMNKEIQMLLTKNENLKYKLRKV